MQRQSGVEKLQKRIMDLERQLAEAQATILALQERNGQASSAVSPNPEPDLTSVGEEIFKQALLAAPHPLFIWQEDGRIVLVNESFTELSGYTRQDIPTHEDWLHKAFDRQILQQPSLIFYEETAGQDVKKAREFEINTRSGEKRVWDISSAALGTDGQNRPLMITMAADITERRQIEEQLEENEQKFAIIFKKAPFAAALSRYQDGTFVDVNDEFERIFGYKKQELLGRTSLEAGIHPEAERRQQILAQIQSQGSARNLEVRLQTKSGEVRDFLVNVDLVSISGQRYILQSAQDVTERKRVEKALQESEQRYRGLFERMQEGLVAAEILLDENGKPVDYRYLDVNPAAERQFNITREQFIGRTYKEVLPEVSQKWIETLGNVALTGQSASIEQYFAASRRWFEAHSYSPRPGQFVSILTDITERKMTEQALRESEERFRSLADSMPQLVWTALPDGRVDYYNQRYKEYQAIKQINRDDWEWAPVLHPADTQATVDAWLHSLETGHVYQIEHRVRMNDGSYRWHLSRGIPMRDEKERIIRWFGTATDIHDLKLAEEQMKLYASRLEKSNRELEQFAFMASHDLQEPLRKIEMFGDLLLERAGSLQERERSYLDRMRDAANRMRDMIEGLLQLSRVATQGKPFVPVSLSQVTANILADQEDRIRSRKAHIEVGPLPVVSGDPLQLRQLMQNLIGNALKYHQPGKPPEIKIFTIELKDKVKICIEDKGIGFDQEDADRIFEPFQRLVGRSQFEGSGIGLAICRRIVERHGGDIAAVSEPGTGTTFVITFPMPPRSNMDNEADKKGIEK